MGRVNHGNREGHDEYNITWHDADPAEGSFTTVLRVKNESRSLPWVLPGLLRVSDRVVLVDNGSDDGTPEVARSVAAENEASERLDVFHYPFNIARCGPEHLSVPADSVHSLTYFYNWSFSHVRTTHSVKWDGDMVLTEDGERYVRELRWALEVGDTIIQIPRVAVYIESENVAYIDTGHVNLEPWIWPNKPEFHFGKAFEWEILIRPQSVPVMLLPEWSLFELKWLDLDEFTNWSAVDFGSGAIRTGRKNREWEVFNAVKKGELPEDVFSVESPGEKHVIHLLREPASAQYVLNPPEHAHASRTRRAQAGETRT